MTETRDQPKTPEASYELTYEPDGTSFTVRENLRRHPGARAARSDPRPGGGAAVQPALAVPGWTHRTGQADWVALTSDDSEGAAERGHLVEVRTDDEALAESRGVPAYAADETEADAEDDDAEDRAPKQGLMIPASMGLRFQVPADLESFTVTASWGTYETVETDEGHQGGPPDPPLPTHPGRGASHDPAGRPHTRSDRDDPAARRHLPARRQVRRPGSSGGYSSRSRCAMTARRRCRSRSSMWMFQTKLLVDAGGAEVFLPVRDVLEQDWPEHDEEVRRLNLQYRNRLEFAIGRTCSADWMVKEGLAACHRGVRRPGCPSARRRRPGLGPVKDALLSMDALSTVTPDELRAGLEPLVTGYGAWLDEQESCRGETALAPGRRRPSWRWGRPGRRTRGCDGPGACRHRPGGTALFPVHEPRDARPAHRLAGCADARIRSARRSSQAQAEVAASGAGAASWRPFQLAFILMQLGA